MGRGGIIERMKAKREKEGEIERERRRVKVRRDEEWGGRRREGERRRG